MSAIDKRKKEMIGRKKNPTASQKKKEKYTQLPDRQVLVHGRTQEFRRVGSSRLVFRAQADQHDLPCPPPPPPHTHTRAHAPAQSSVAVSWWHQSDFFSPIERAQKKTSSMCSYCMKGSSHKSNNGKQTWSKTLTSDNNEDNWSTHQHTRQPRLRKQRKKFSF